MSIRGTDGFSPFYRTNTELSANLGSNKSADLDIYSLDLDIDEQEHLDSEMKATNSNIGCISVSCHSCGCRTNYCHTSDC